MEENYEINNRQNRFQVNPVSMADMMFRTGDENETYDDDTFNDADIVLRNNNRRSSRYGSTKPYTVYCLPNGRN